MYNLLDGYRIIEGAAFIAGPSCGLHMAQMGAEVIRIDPIGGGPDYNRWPIAPNGKSLYWEGLNKGKKSIQINTRQQEGRELAIALATAPGEKSGLFLTNYPVNSFLNHNALESQRSDIITARIMGWSDGSPAVDYTINAAVGIPLMTGPSDYNLPVNHVLPAWDLLGGAYAAFCMTSAILKRQTTGEGSEIRISLSDLAATSMGHLGNIAETLTYGDRPKMGNDLYGAFGRDFSCKDGIRIIVVAITANQWRGLIKVFNLQDEITKIEQELNLSFDDDEGARFKHRDLLIPIFEKAFSINNSFELQKSFDENGVTWGRYQSLANALSNDDRLFKDNPQFQDLLHPSGLTYPTPGPAGIISGAHRGDVKTAPILGENTDEILSNILKLDSNQIGQLHDRKIVA